MDLIASRLRGEVDNARFQVTFDRFEQAFPLAGVCRSRSRAEQLRISLYSNYVGLRWLVRPFAD
ncbi:MAG TPA: hypothetical protein VEW25_01240 [Allosphingosinicella sp.]|nr:hypothetical protein [Allosphingosinicella sp.]